MAGSVFGLGSSLNTTLTTYCLIGIVIFTIAFESFTHHAEHKLKGTPYVEMLAKVYKEMMIMGFISFGIFMAVQAGGVGHGETLVSFEFAHIVIFFAALIFVLTALVFIFFSSRLKILYERSASTTADHLLGEYALARHSPWFHKMHWFGGSSKLRDMMEFKMVHLHFQMVYDLPNDFNFASYMQECLDHYILDLIEVDPSTWVFFLVLALLNLGVDKLMDLITYSSNDTDYDSSNYSSSDETSHHSSSYYSSSSDSSGSDCDHFTSTSHSHRWLGGSSSAAGSYSSDPYSEGDHGLFTFILGGWFLVVWVIILYMAARHSELKLLLKAGAQSTHHYESVLVQVEEELEAREREREAEGQELLSLEELQGKIAQLKAELEQAHQEAGLQRHASDLDASLHGTPLSKALPRPLATKALALHQGTGRLISQKAKLAPTTRRLASGRRTLPHKRSSRGSGGERGAHLGSSPKGETKDLDAGDDDPALADGAGNGDPESLSSTEGHAADSNHDAGAQGRVSLESLSSAEGAAADSNHNAEAQGRAPRRRRSSLGRRLSLGDGPHLSEAVQRVRAELREKNQQLQLKMAAVAAMGVKAGRHVPGAVRYSLGGHVSSSMLTDTFYENEALTKLVAAPHPQFADEPSRSTMKSSKSVVEASAPGTMNASLTLKSDINDVYPFGSRRFFQKAIEIFLLLACMYGALYFANFCIVAQYVGVAPAVAHLLMLVPAFIFVPVMGRVVKTSSLLQAVAEIKPGIIAKVIEETIDTQKMAATVSEKIKAEITRLGGDPSTPKDILVFFDTYAKPGSGEMGPREFRLALHCMHVHLSDARFLRLFKHFELNKDGALTAQEAAQVLWPAEAAAEAEQARRLRGKMAHGASHARLLPKRSSSTRISPAAPVSTGNSFRELPHV